MSSVPSGPEYDPEVEYQHGTADLQAGKYKDAVTDFEHVTEAAPRSANGWLMLGEAREGAGDEQGRPEGLRALGEDRRQLGAGAPRARAGRRQAEPDGQGERRAGQPADQGDGLRRHLPGRRRPRRPRSPPSRPRCRAPAARPPRPAASNDLPTHLSVATPQAGDGAYVRAVSLINERRWDEALASLDKAETALGPHPDILTYKGYVWRKKGDWAKAEDFYQPGARASTPATAARPSTTAS